MGSLDASVKRALANAQTVDRQIGVFVGVVNGRGLVDVGGGRIPADLCGFVPDINDTVWVLFVGATATILGPTVLKPGQGIIAGAPSSNLVPVDLGNGGPAVLLAYASGLTLSNGQVVKLGAWNQGGFVFAVVSTTPPAAPAAAAPSSGPLDQTAVFTATDSGSYRSGNGWWQAQVWASDTNTGAWFYGSKIADTIPDGATIVSVEIYISPTQITGWPPNFGTHLSGGKPGGNVAISNQTAVGVRGGWVGLPASFGNVLKASVGGIGVDHGGYSLFRSIAQDAQSGALRIHWVS